MDLKLLRRDEINFINKDEQGYSTIYSLDNYDVRFDKKVVTEYLNGHYGAVPKWWEASKKRRFSISSIS